MFKGHKILLLLGLTLLLLSAGCGGPGKLEIKSNRSNLPQGGGGSAGGNFACEISASTTNITVLVDSSGQLSPGYEPPSAELIVRGLKEGSPVPSRIVNVIFNQNALRQEGVLNDRAGAPTGVSLRPLAEGTHPVEFQVVDASDPTLGASCEISIAMTKQISNEVEASIKANGVETRFPTNGGIANGSTVRIHWRSVNTTSCQVFQGTKNHTSTFGEFISENLVNHTSVPLEIIFRATCVNASGTSDTATVSVFVNPNPSVDLSAAGPTQVAPGGAVTLNWTSTSAASQGCTMSDGTRSFAVANNGSRNVENIRANVTFRITCRDNNVGVAEDLIEITVADPNLAYEMSINLAGDTRAVVPVLPNIAIPLVWETSGVTACTLSDGTNVFNVAADGTRDMGVPGVDKSYTLTCLDGAGIARSVMVQVNIINPRITAFTVSISGQNTTLTWSSAEVTDCSISGIGGVDNSGSRNVGLVNADYILTCQSVAGPRVARLGTFHCASGNMRTVTCSRDYEIAQIQAVSQVSHSACRANSTYKILANRTKLEVNTGCRANFGVRYF